MCRHLCQAWRPEVRLLTLTGTGGVGKTRVALAVAQALRDTFADGVCFVSLAAIRDEQQVIPTVAQALGLQTGIRPILEAMQAALLHRQLLLVLDNAEHVVRAAPALADLLLSCAEVRMLVTSREPLHVEGEHEFPLLPLPLPEDAQAEVGRLADNPAVTLFVQRAQAIQPDFQLTAANAATITAICGAWTASRWPWNSRRPAANSFHPRRCSPVSPAACRF